MNSAPRPDIRLSYLDSGDVGRFVATILTEKPAKWNGEIISMASVSWRMEEIVKSVTDATDGKKVIKADHMPLEEAGVLAKVNPIVEAELFWNDYRSEVDLERVKSFGIPLRTWEELASRNNNGLEAAIGL